MKTVLRSIVAGMLAALARGILAKYEPKIVMVTGSVGKTSTKDAVAACLSERYFLRASEKSYNSEFGVPLTIIGAKNPWTSFSAWLGVFAHGLSLLLFPNHYPKLLVLEVGADRPGDLKQILRIATPHAVVVTKLPDVPVHVEAYATPEAVREEEFAPAHALPAGAPLVICEEDAHAKRLARATAATLSTYGFTKDADVSLGEASVISGSGMRSVATIRQIKYELCVEGALGRQQLYAPAAALTLALALGMKEKEALAGLRNYVPPPGRARILPGRNGSILIDDTYNASPAAVIEIVSALPLMPGITRRIVVLGDMLELGRYSKEEHARVGKLAAGVAQVIVSVGERAKAVHEAVAAEREAYHYTNSREAAAALTDFVREGDLVLIKGSQGIRMERITEALLRNPQDRGQLVRQDKEWLKKA